jgi:hypothetical protein
MLARVIAILTAATLIVGLVGTVVSNFNARVTHAIAEARDRDRDRNHIRRLEDIIVREWPQYTKDIDWDDK